MLRSRKAKIQKYYSKSNLEAICYKIYQVRTLRPGQEVWTNL